MFILAQILIIILEDSSHIILYPTYLIESMYVTSMILLDTAYPLFCNLGSHYLLVGQLHIFYY